MLEKVENFIHANSLKLSPGFWIRTIPSEEPIGSEFVASDVEGPLLLASTHTDFEEFDSSTTKDTEDVSMDQITENHATDNSLDSQTTVKISERSEKPSPTIQRKKSISDDLVVNVESVTQLNIDPNGNEDVFQTEVYEIADLFPNPSEDGSSVMFDESSSETSTQTERR